jgi:hypothetical protein
MKASAALVLLSLAGMTGAEGQLVYRCGSQYSQTPCPQATAIDVSDSRTEAQRADAQRVAEAYRRLAARMRRDRLDAEYANTPAFAVSLSGPGKAYGRRPLFGRMVGAPQPLPETDSLDP